MSAPGRVIRGRILPSWRHSKKLPSHPERPHRHLPKGKPIEIRFQDEARIGQKNGIVRQWARRGTRPRQPADQRYDNAWLFGAICPARGKAAGLTLGCIVHSDRGNHYGSHDFQKKLLAHGLLASMSGKGNYFDNAAVETVFKSLKAERLWRQNRSTRREATTAIFQYINRFYNPRRRHSYLGGISLLAFKARAA